MKKPVVILSGPAIAVNETLIEQLRAHVTIRTTPEHVRSEKLLQKDKADIFVYEIVASGGSELNILEKIRQSYPDLKIVLVDTKGDKRILAKAFALGAKDAFPASGAESLLAERILALLSII